MADLAAEIYARSLPDPEDDPEPAFEDRRVRVETTFAGAGVMSGDLTPECAAVVTAVLESLAAPMGAEDTRTREQRYYDALQEVMRRLAAIGLLPERAGQPVKAVVHVSLAELRAMDDGSVLEAEWTTEMRIRWAARRAEASGGVGGDGGAWLDGDAARAVSCDASLSPVVTGDVDPCALDDLVRLCLQLADHGAHCAPAAGRGPSGPAGPDPGPADQPGHIGDPADPAGHRATAAPGDPPDGLAQPSTMSREAIQQAIIGKTINLLLHSRMPLDLRTFHSTDMFIPIANVWEAD